MDEGTVLSSSLWMTLPNEVVVLILEFMSVTELATCATVSSQWRALADSNALWMAHFQRTHPPLLGAVPSSSFPGQGWEHLFSILIRYLIIRN